MVLFDRRGAGLSDRSPAAERLGLGALASDIAAVLDACDAGQAALFGVTAGCPVAVGFAASYPDRAPARSRKLTCREQALLALRWFRDRTRPERLAADHGISRATAYRYLDEAVDVLSAQAPGLGEALERAMSEGVPYVILDGKIFETDRLAETVTSAKGEDINAWYSGKKHRPGANVQAVMLPGGLPAWTGPAEPGHVHDITAARAHALPGPLPRRRGRNADAGRRRLRGSRDRHPRPR